MKNVFLILSLFSFIVFPVFAQDNIPDSSTTLPEHEQILCPETQTDSVLTVTDPVTQSIVLGDSLAELWDHTGAAEAYFKVLEYDSSNYQATWKAADQVTEMANALPDPEKEQKENQFQKACELCEKAIEINPQGWEGHFYLSVALGRLALFRGGKEKIKLSKQIKAEADTAIILNSEADLAYHVLGRWHQELANLGWVLRTFAKILFGRIPPASNEESVAMFKKAIEIDPYHIEHHLELARTYKIMGEKQLMREPLETVLALPSVEKDDPEFKKEAEQMLKKLK
jgi:tetratricopeptide (TPR) repeat protein